jgi:hypothetical protein
MIRAVGGPMSLVRISARPEKVAEADLGIRLVGDEGTVEGSEGEAREVVRHLPAALMAVRRDLAKG